MFKDFDKRQMPRVDGGVANSALQNQVFVVGFIVSCCKGKKSVIEGVDEDDSDLSDDEPSAYSVSRQSAHGHAFPPEADSTVAVIVHPGFPCRCLGADPTLGIASPHETDEKGLIKGLFTKWGQHRREATKGGALPWETDNHTGIPTLEMKTERDTANEQGPGNEDGCGPVPPCVSHCCWVARQCLSGVNLGWSRRADSSNICSLEKTYQNLCVKIVFPSRNQLLSRDLTAAMLSKRAKTKKHPQCTASNVVSMFIQSQIQEFREAFNMIA
ncbi:hypothetical protein Celaphus_00018730 [Cervus elaphus hippelaphus]|uniref:Uncharacterized protein n=1 Tax=Cervus elaphus hippelaphus TaxID=46360 RepID=A0A212C634_CEREH|nr:hypothetical protein Celaphus_00018730 [Cervus elaphus hippelaphus]